jgi:hypothetical protein
MFSSLLFNQRTRRFWNARAEPDFGPLNAGSLKNHQGKPAVVPKVSTPSRRTDAAGPPVGILLYLASVGLIAAAIIGVLFGTGFCLLASPASETTTDSGRDPSRLNGNALKAGGEVVLGLAGRMETPHSLAVNLIPGLPTGQRPPSAAAAPPQQNNVMRELPPASSSDEPPVETTAWVPQPVSGAAVAPAEPVPLANPPAVAAAGDGALSAGNKGPTAHDGRSAHARTVSRHSRPRSARSGSTLTPPRSLFAQTLTPPQTSSSRPDPHAANRAD